MSIQNFLSGVDKIDGAYWFIVILGTLVYALSKSLREAFIKNTDSLPLKQKWARVGSYFAEPHVVIANAMTFLCGVVIMFITTLSQNTPGAFLERSATIVGVGTMLGGAFILGYLQDKVSMRQAKDSGSTEEKKDDEGQQ